MEKKFSDLNYSALDPNIDAEAVLDYLHENGAHFLGSEDADMSHLESAEISAMLTPQEIYQAYKMCARELLLEIKALSAYPRIEDSIAKKVDEGDPSYYEMLETIQESALYLSSVICSLGRLEQNQAKSIAVLTPNVSTIDALIDSINAGKTPNILEENIFYQRFPDFSLATKTYLEMLEMLLFFTDYQAETHTPDERLVKYLLKRTQNWIAVRQNNDAPQLDLQSSSSWLLIPFMLNQRPIICPLVEHDERHSA